jgi:hypothetical protein
MSLFSPLLGVLQNEMTPMTIGNSPLFDFLQRSKAAKTDDIIVEAAISDARRLSGAVDSTHLGRQQLRAPNLITPAKGNPGTRTVMWPIRSSYNRAGTAIGNLI